MTDEVVARLRAAGCVFAEEEAAVLRDGDPDPVRLSELVARRVSGLPLEHVVGWAWFGGRRVLVDPGVFVPRRRTEVLVARAAAYVRGGSVVVDLCCGSGALGAVLAAGADGPVELYAADVDPAAVHCARRNVTPLGGTVYEGDLYDALPPSLRGRVDVLVANVPYVPTGEIGLLPAEARLHEAPVALDGGADGLDVAGRIAAGAGAWLAPGGRVFLECGEHQSSAAAAALRAGGLTPSLHHDDDLDVTVASGHHPGLS
ncbi:methylase [Catellatospora sp. TT07R-123]|uniref:putative protein N(5)-glutamine methyltransferase n=1 Tax=Catellatospora sp. TT07R-123 TaxID=2733863 RepID=UPI001B111832|nr:putative protein N(5)-glutamine methyltransferase [Catellatospora sp. TT07R-123]GHJ49413.1 methylase [Catellatospora sp. TT07R-123]